MAHAGRLVAGIDVGVRRSSVVILRDGTIDSVTRIDSPRALPNLVQQCAAIAIDGPPGWAPHGQRSRAGERALAALGIHCFFTPDRATGNGHPFYGWMETSIALHRAAGRSGAVVLEVFPNATAILAVGRAAPQETKTRWRRRAAFELGLDDPRLRSIDDVDAALAAWTAAEHQAGRTEALAGELTVPRK
ncbi:MAG: DUF429 domain-containing protein [Acidimicrobiia bacterium]